MGNSFVCLLITAGCIVAYIEGWATNGYIAGLAIFFAFISICLAIDEQTDRIIEAHRDAMQDQTQEITNEIMEIKR